MVLLQIFSWSWPNASEAIARKSHIKLVITDWHFAVLAVVHVSWLFNVGSMTFNVWIWITRLFPPCLGDGRTLLCTFSLQSISCHDRSCARWGQQWMRSLRDQTRCVHFYGSATWRIWRKARGTILNTSRSGMKFIELGLGSVTIIHYSVSRITDRRRGCNWCIEL